MLLQNNDYAFTISVTLQEAKKMTKMRRTCAYLFPREYDIVVICWILGV